MINMNKLQLGFKTHQAGQLQNTIEYYRKAIKLNPVYVESHENLNKLLWELEDNAVFLSSYKEAFTQVPVSPSSTILLCLSVVKNQSISSRAEVSWSVAREEKQDP